MAIIHFQNTKKECKVRDGSNLMKVCSDAGIPFGCTSGNCGVCRVRVLKGAENVDQPLDANKEILPCITRIVSGEIKISYRE